MASVGRQAVDALASLVGAALGGYAGYRIFVWLLNHGLYGLVIPGALLGLGCGLFSRYPSRVRGIVCAVAAVATGLLSEWCERAFQADPSLSFFLTHLNHLDALPWTLGMIVLGALMAYWWGGDAIPAPWMPRKPPRPREV